MLSPRFTPELGGVERHLSGLIVELARRGHQLSLITCAPNQDDPQLANQQVGALSTDSHPQPPTKNHAREISAPASSSSSSSALRLHLLSPRARQEKWVAWRQIWAKRALLRDADLIHIHDLAWWLYPFLPLLKWWRKPLFITFHGYERNQGPTRRAVWQRRWIESWVDGSICIGAFMKTWYRAKSNLVSYGAIDLTPALKSEVAQLPPPSALFLGRLAEDTAILHYLEALTLMPTPCPLHVYGEGPLLARARAFVAQHHLPVTFHPSSSRARQFIPRARWVFASQYLAILEAMEAGRLVVALASHPFKRDYLKTHPQASAMILASSAADLVTQLEALTPDQEAKRVARAKRWARHQTWSNLADLYETCWQNR